MKIFQKMLRLSCDEKINVTMAEVGFKFDFLSSIKLKLRSSQVINDS
jgi:hypothetical protein